jgi:dihydrofolate reductase
LPTHGNLCYLPCRKHWQYAFKFKRMRKVIVSMNITLDGHISGPNCELDWHFDRWGPDMGERLGAELNKTDIILLGRISYEAMAKYWPRKETDMSCPRDDIAFAFMMNKHHKVVYSNTLQKTNWNNSTLIKGNIKDEINKLKQSNEKGNKNIIIYGSTKLVSTLMQLGLIDEYQLWVHPIILGKGKPLFRKLKDRSSLKLLNTEIFKSGVIFLHYVTIFTSQE